MIYRKAKTTTTDFIIVTLARHVATTICSRCRRKNGATKALLAPLKSGKGVSAGVTSIQTFLDSHPARDCLCVREHSSTDVVLIASNRVPVVVGQNDGSRTYGVGKEERD